MFSARPSVKHVVGLALLGALVGPTIALSQSPARQPKTAAVTDTSNSSAPGDYVIGPSDVLGIVFWREDKLSMDAVVRPDGKISLPLLNDVQAAGLTPDQLRGKLTESARRFLADPVVAVTVKQVNNNRVFITGQVSHQGPVALAGPTTVLQLIATAGGLSEFADRKHIMVTRVERGATTSYTFNYDEVVKGKNLAQNIVLKPGDTVVVP